MFGCKNDPAKFILGHPFFSPFAKISFSVYLTHFIVIMNGSFSSRMNLYWQEMSVIYVIVTDIILSLATALVLSLLV
jgi:peptidoglycan/LPS O-acetylase OafA/YrhL